MRALVFVILLPACLPNPQSVAERRESFDREPLMGRFILSELPPMTEVHAIFDGPIELVGHTVSSAAPARGDEVEIVLYWRATRPIGEDLTVFVHGDATGGNARRVHGDHLPAGGRYPTDVWLSGDIVANPFTIDIPKDYGPPALSLFVGLYRDQSRVALRDRGLALADGENRSRAIDLAIH